MLGLLFGLNSCLNEEGTGEDPYKRLAEEVAIIDQTLVGIPNVIKDPSGVRIRINELGTGLPAKLNSKIHINYTGSLFSSGQQFEVGIADQKLSGYIAGWKIAFTILPVGTKARLYIPSGYGYGNRPNGSIPANSILVFDVTFNAATPTTTELNQLKTDSTTIASYIETNEIEGVVTDSTSLHYKITQQGTGDPATWFDEITMSYSIKLLTNPGTTVISVERTPSAAFASRLVDYIHGMKVGLSKMNVGSKATLYIPSYLAFGTEGASDGTGTLVIPPNANLIVEIHVTDIDYK
jgi:FKBP-type peptidyl-prolyl cis-trans isomerase